MAFDPYETWLGIPADRRPPTHYDLLGLAPFESDPEVIEQAALRRMSRVRQHQIGPYSDQSQEVLAELARARLILMDRDRRAEYDARLRARATGDSGSSAAPHSLQNELAAPRPSESFERLPAGLASLDLTAEKTDGSLNADRNSENAGSLWNRRLLIGAIVASHVGVLGVFVAFVLPWLRNPKAADSAPRNPAALTSTPKQKPTAPPATKSGLAEMPSPTPAPKPNPPHLDPKPDTATKPKAPLMAEQGQAEPSGGERKSATLSVTTRRQTTQDGHGAAGRANAKPRAERADITGKTASTNDDDIAEQLRRSKATYDTTQKRAKAELLKALDQEYERISKTKTLKARQLNDRLRYIDDERRAFRDDDVLPDRLDSRNKQMVKDIVTYEKTMTNAQRLRLKEYDTAEGEYRQRRHNDRARAVRAERWDFHHQTAVLLDQLVKELVLVPTGEIDPPPSWHTWYYTTVEPGKGTEWTSPRFDTSRWNRGPGAFCSDDPLRKRSRTDWINSRHIWLRTLVRIPRVLRNHVLTLRVAYDDQVAIYVNGELLIEREYAGGRYIDIQLDPSQERLFHRGLNTLAVHCADIGVGGAFIDVGLTLNQSND